MTDQGASTGSAASSDRTASQQHLGKLPFKRPNPTNKGKGLMVVPFSLQGPTLLPPHWLPLILQGMMPLEFLFRKKDIDI